MTFNSVSNLGLQPLVKLPSGWICTTIGEISEAIQYGFTAKAAASAKGRLKLLRITDIQNDSVDWDSVPYCEIDVPRKKNYLLAEGDLVFARTGATVGKSYLIKDNVPEAVFASYLIRIVFNNEINKTFVSHFFHSQQYWEQIRKGQLGIGQPNVNSQVLSKIELPLPPIAEQRRIAAKIEELFTRIDAGAQYLRAAHLQLQNYRKSVLKYAFEGKLTKLWREDNKNKTTPVTEFLKHIKSNKLGSAKQGGISYLNLNNVSELPESWMWTQIGQISDLSAGNAFKKSEYANQGVRLLQIANVSFGSIVWDKVAYLPESYLQKYPNLALRTGDVVMALNRPVLSNQLKIGKLKEKDTPAILYQRVGRLDFYDARVGPYIYYCTQSQQFVKDLKASLQGVDQPFINKPRLLDIAVPLAPLEEQPHVVEEIERRLSVIDTVKQQIEQNTQYVETARRAILKKAFTGRLVAQDPREEPASEALERIADIQSRTRTAGRSHRIRKSYQTELRQNGG